MKALILTNEYPPTIYGGAGVHVDYLSRALAKFCTIDVRCFGNQKIEGKTLTATGFGLSAAHYTAPKPLRIVFGAVQRCIDFNTAHIDADIVHCHTWYTHFGGVLAKLNYSIPLIVTVHSLEPLRPWKREQLGGGYDFSSWVEKTALQMADAVIAVSQETKSDILRCYDLDPEKVHIIHNGIDLDEYRRVQAPEVIKSQGIDPTKPYVLFVGRISRQKGIIHMVNAIRYFDPGFQVVLAARSPDTEEIETEMAKLVAKIQSERPGVIWIRDLTDTDTKVALYAHASVFCCPSIYEPFGIINLEAMACEVPVVASAVGGIKEVVVHGQTGFLVPVQRRSTDPYEPIDPTQFAKDLAEKINLLMNDEALRRKMGAQGRQRAINFFSWHAVAEKTYRLYQSLVTKK